MRLLFHFMRSPRYRGGWREYQMSLQATAEHRREFTRVVVFVCGAVLCVAAGYARFRGWL